MQIRTGTLRAAIIGLTMLKCAAASASPAIDGARDSREETAIRALLTELVSWTDAEETYRATSRPISKIKFVDAGETVTAEGQEFIVADRTRGLYDEKKATIYLARPWSVDDPFDRSVLLHELAHHLQVNTRHWYCPQAMEWDAYRLQETWLVEHGIQSGFYWPAILLESSCSKRDHHPD